MNMPKISIGSNCATVELDGLTLWFSYGTLIAFRSGGETFVRENDWGPTTGKHLNAVDGGDKKNRLPSAKFQAAWD